MRELCRSPGQRFGSTTTLVRSGKLTGGATRNGDDLAGLRRNCLAEFGKPFGRLGRRREPTHDAIELGMTAVCVIKILQEGRKSNRPCCRKKNMKIDLFLDPSP
jgi:hypothetical protein